VDFEPKGESTNVVLIHERFRDANVRQQHADGWAGCFRHLERKFAR
jgi:hypothetical protein